MILANTYHLMLRPGEDVVAKLGGVHRFMAWDGPILTDSGGYQVFSLAHLRRVDDSGVLFRSHIDGSEVSLTPERAVETQRRLGADVIMQLDECPPGSARREEVAIAVRRSAEWAEICRKVWQDSGCLAAGGEYHQSLFGIQQGGTHADLRAESARRLVDLDLPGYAIGGLSVGEGHQAMVDVLDQAAELLPADRPRYLMGVGEPRDIIAAVLRGVDMFDCVLPTRNARNAQAFTWSGRVRLRNACHAEDPSPIEDGCDCYACRHFSRGTIRHLFSAGEMLAPTLTTIHNLRFFARLMATIREAILSGDLEQRSEGWLDRMYHGELDNG
jgi:queuine tRNA-ribosyltransferase